MNYHYQIEENQVHYVAMQSENLLNSDPER